jgi:hypothetical protein
MAPPGLERIGPSLRSLTRADFGSDQKAAGRRGLVIYTEIPANNGIRSTSACVTPSGSSVSRQQIFYLGHPYQREPRQLW